MIRNLFLSAEMNNSSYQSIISRTLIIALSILLFLMSIELMGVSIGAITGGFAESISAVTANPFIGLFIGLLSTALLQSSSTTTSIAVAAVASGAISLQNAIPIVMGANVGTTITSTIISMSYISKQKEFRKAVAAGTSHDFFNILTVLFLFPLEVNYRFLERISAFISSNIHVSGRSGVGQGAYGFSSIFDTCTTWLVTNLGPIITLVLGIILLFACIKFISKWLYKILIGKTKDRFENVVFKNRYRAFGWGLVITSIAQSSSLTTSLIVPLVATGKVKIKKAFQFILGANIGTTITALLAAIFQSEAAISLALVHLLFNLIGVMVFFLIPVLTKVPVYLAKKMGLVTMRIRLVGFAYILVAFFLLPFTLIYFSQVMEKSGDPVEIRSED
ncbi:solute carrier family 34 (sodium-dependent phosphate cotransporter) [Ekhidna lutea]|uniref:Solute carrier family 34 (Sodium-dependent phosphate cotransporter) n=1 Tax=Ekhidna lutea TaxID=447679 RepID=A0A239KNI3_EKHLU|nr:Na/Pi symporter [Ekhidna lutea]SNT19590.1 solute carrier family 34 (sodium-dependent phosphate cotransporter) [Ekhidna lutea]